MPRGSDVLFFDTGGSRLRLRLDEPPPAIGYRPSGLKVPLANGSQILTQPLARLNYHLSTGIFNRAYDFLNSAAGGFFSIRPPGAPRSIEDNATGYASLFALKNYTETYRTLRARAVSNAKFSITCDACCRTLKSYLVHRKLSSFFFLSKIFLVCCVLKA